MPFLSKFVVLSVEVGYSFNLFCFPTNQLVCGHIFHSSCKYTWGNLSWFYLFLQNLMLKHCLLFPSMIYYLWQDFYSITNWLIYWGPCRPSWRYLCYRIHAQACTIQVRLKTHAPLFHLCFLIFFLDLLEPQVYIKQFIEPNVIIFTCIPDPAHVTHINELI